MAYNTIKIKKYLDIVEEYEANAALFPGHLVELMSTGKIRKHATAEGTVLPMFALEDELQGNDNDTAYAAADRVQVWIPNRGEIVLAVLKDGQNVAIGDFLESAGDGTLQKHVNDEDSWESNSKQEPGNVTVIPQVIVGTALEAVDLSGSSGEEDSGALDWDKRILVRII
jgi:hypothetical protein